jgi:hypothetical protein
MKTWVFLRDEEYRVEGRPGRCYGIGTGGFSFLERVKEREIE